MISFISLAVLPSRFRTAAGDGSSTLFTYAEDDGDGEFLIEDNRQMIFPAYPRFLPQGE